MKVFCEYFWYSAGDHPCLSESQIVCLMNAVHKSITGADWMSPTETKEPSYPSAGCQTLLWISSSGEQVCLSCLVLNLSCGFFFSFSLFSWFSSYSSWLDVLCMWPFSHLIGCHSPSLGSLISFRFRNTQRLMHIVSVCLGLTGNASVWFNKLCVLASA